MADPVQSPPRPKAAPRAAGPKTGWRADAAAFWVGFSQPSALAFASFSASLLASLALCLWFFSESTVASSYGRYLPRSKVDDFGFVTHIALREGRIVADHPRLFILGTSTIAQSFGSGRELETMIRKATGQDWQVVMLVTALQNTAEQFALIDRALESQTATSARAVVALGTGLQRLRWTTDDPLRFAEERRLGLRSDWEDDEVAQLGGTAKPRTGFYPYDNYRFVLLNGAEALLRLTLGRAAQRVVDRFAVGTPGAFPQSGRDSMGERMRRTFLQRDQYFKQIDRLLAHMATRPNASLVLFQELLSPGLLANQKLGEIGDQLSRETAEYVASRGIGYLPISIEAQLPESDFFDDLHVFSDDALQDTIRQLIVRHLVQMLAAEDQSDGT